MYNENRIYSKNNLRSANVGRQSTRDGRRQRVVYHIERLTKYCTRGIEILQNK